MHHMTQRNKLWIVMMALATVMPEVSMSETWRPDISLSNRWYRNLYAVSNQYWACSSAGMTAATNLAEQAARHGYTGVVTPIHYFFMTQWTTAHT
jgi:hypothetical protein